MNKPDLIHKIKQPEGITLTPEEQSYLLDLINTKKKYGLVWEEKTEDVEEQLRTHLPVLTEVVERKIRAKPEASPNPSQGGESKKALQNLQTSLFEPDINEKNSPSSSLLGRSGGASSPNHILIEGDNLHALTALSFTHEGLIDVMYFDPPYNTGNKDFKYNDSYVDKEDSYRHSKWLSFMEKRLRIAKRLLSEKGVIFISIDDNEQAQLKLLCDEIMGAENFISNIANINNPKGRSDDKYIATAHEYIIIYRKSVQFKMGGFEPEEKITKRYKKSDFIGVYREIDLRKTGDGDERSDRPNMFYPFYYNSLNGDFFATEIENAMLEGYISIWPMKSLTLEGRWRWGLENSKANISKLVPKYMPSKKQWTVFEKDYLNKRENIKSTSVWDFKDVNSERGTELFIKSLGFEKSNFQNPKPIGTLNRIIKLSTSKTSIILDFFAGSGTTLHATMQLNAEDGGNRQCILVTNNENKICEEVTYERNRRVIQGYSNSKGDWVPGLTNNNLRYYKTGLVPSMRDEPNKRLLAQTSTDLLCIKEDCYTELTEPAGFNPAQCRIFTNEGGKYLMIVFHSRQQLEVYEQLITYIKSLGKLSENIKLYAFSPEKETLLEDFAEIAESIDAVPLPEAIYNAYRATFRTLKLDKKPVQTTHDEKTGDADES